MPANPLQSFTGRVALVATVVVGIIFIKLGLWQMDRAAEKSSMLAASEQAGAREITSVLGTGDVTADLYRKYQLTGKFVSDKQFLLDNKIHNGAAGYEVLTPFRLSSNDSYILVNRGWTSVGNDRNTLPDLHLNQGENEEVPVVVLLSLPSKGFAIGPAMLEADTAWPRRLQFVDYNAITDAAQIELARPAVFVSQPGQSWNLQYNFKTVANGPEKHYGYAFQWFAMLAALLFLYIYLTFLKRDD